MNTEQACQLVDLLGKQNITLERGLTDEEVERVETTYAIEFPPDLKLLLQTALPVSPGFPNWRLALTSPDEYKETLSQLDWPWEGMVFDMEHGFWLKQWGPRPDSKEEQLSTARQYYDSWPRLIPIYIHRYIPSTPLEAGNPIFSVYQMDIIYYGMDLANYLSGEFKFELPDNFIIPEAPKPIAFWGPWAAGD
jgi:hypothetical protein